MKTIIIAGTIALLLSFPSIGLANNCPLGVKSSISKNDLSDDIRGGSIEVDYMSSYINTKGNKDEDIKRNQPLPKESCVIAHDFNSTTKQKLL